MRLKIDLYRRLARVGDRAELEDFAGELKDRFGCPPPEAERLLALAGLRIAAHHWRIHSIRMEDHYVVLSYSGRRLVEKLRRLSGRRLRVVDDQTAYLPLSQEVTEPDQILAQVKSLLQLG
jgi:transcription-repair coupling factor (superfamily II helicase)